MPAVAALVAVLALAGCNTETALNSAGPQPSATPPPSAGANPTAESSGGRTDTKAALPAVDLSAERLQFAPIVGATVESVAPLAKELSARAGQRGLKLVPANDPSTTLLLKGYFSALSDNDKTTVIYVWDVLDPAGNRLHRIEGQEKAPAGKGHGFAAVTDDTMRAIADQTIDQLISWLAARKA
ncbi:MAG: hypothetical protein ACTHLP_16715 [Rhizobiaceae bacterium]